ncbi:MAG: hypothetical protein KA187_00115 [Arenimonas sp.]|nr:hypothetical protein [Arenimonas sp.]MBP6625798.1 hypothetical protein [Arenimonas sp.]
MTAGREALLTTGPAMLLFAAIFLGGQGVHPFRRWVQDRRSVLSFTAGMSAAYVFVRMMPELSEARELIRASSDSLWLPYEGVVIYFLALLGFLGSYGLDRLRARHATLAGEGRGGHERAMHVGGTAAYVGLMCYLLVRSAGASTAATVAFAVAFSGHFLAISHGLYQACPGDYLNRGRWLLASSCLAGWAVGVVVALPPLVLALLMAFISGGVIMTNALMELSEERNGRFMAFTAGALIYGLLLIPLSQAG